MKRAIGSAVTITIFTLAAQAVALLSQMVIADIFGARPEMDAFLAANTLPQYFATILAGSLGFVFIPVFVDYKARGLDDEAWRLASNVINFCLLTLVILISAGSLFAKPLLHLTTPGLNQSSLEIGTRVSIIVWPTVLASSLVALLSSIYQAEGRFGWQAAVPVIGSLVTLGILCMLSERLGVIGMAIATTTGLLAQACLLLRVILRPGRYRPVIDIKDPGLRQLVRLFLPLLILSFFTKFTPVVERYFASGLQEGSISHLNYAFKAAGILAVLIAAGTATVIFPRMSLDFSGGDTAALKNTISMSLRAMWLIIAPVTAIGFSLCLPFVTFFFQRGEFTPGDSLAVSGMLKLYLFALGGMCLGNITGRAFYVMKDTRTLAVFGIVELLAYIVYTFLFAKWFGAIGIVLAYMLYFNISLAWQLLVLRIKTGNTGGRRIASSFARIAVAALSAGMATYIVTMALKAMPFQLLAGGFAGAAVYLASLFLVRSSEIKFIWNGLKR